MRNRIRRPTVRLTSERNNLYMSVMSETAVTLSDLITMGYKMIASTREALNDLEAFF